MEDRPHNSMAVQTCNREFEREREHPWLWLKYHTIFAQMEKKQGCEAVKPSSYTPIADLLVDLTDTQQEQHLFLVSSANLRVASPVWRKLLDPDSKFAPLKTVSVDGKEYKKITVEGVEVEALQIILGILHYDTQKVPQIWTSRLEKMQIAPATRFFKLDFLILRDLALLLDQYDCLGITSHFAVGWLGSGMDKAVLCDPDYTAIGCEDWIFMASVFGRLQSGAGVCYLITKLVSEKLIKDVCVDNRGPEQEAKYYRWKRRPCAPVDSGNSTIVKAEVGDGNMTPVETRSHNGITFDLVEVSLDSVPETILDFILERRSSLSRRMLSPLYDFVQEFLHTDSTKDTRGRFCANKECSAIALGSLIHSLKEHGFQHLLTKGLAECQLLPEGRFSLQDLVSRIQEVQVTTFQVRNIHRAMESDDLDGLIKRWAVIQTSASKSTNRLPRERVSGVPHNYSMFQRNDRDIGNPQNNYTQTCPLALTLAKIKADSNDVLESVKGYETCQV
ncbi:hypothetical protein TWF481_011415 [Arthrobotrys musiformis]|uniref:BTB domain-containing protein n=1 Tax=Arthrobotrys musiformis TaxID=47236 RepID=A0AAV9W0D4_9PEZI